MGFITNREGTNNVRALNLQSLAAKSLLEFDRVDWTFLEQTQQNELQTYIREVD